MNPEVVFTASNYLAIIGWLLLMIAPHWRYTRPAIFSGLILLLAALYTVLIASTITHTNGGFGSLAQVATLFEDRWALLAGWVHYLAFDLLVGCWISADARRIKAPHLVVIPCLFFTFMFGPFGYLVYRGVRLYKNNKLFLDIHETA